MNYEEYSTFELRDALRHIDKEKYPDRTELLEQELEKRESKDDSSLSNNTLEEEYTFENLIAENPALYFKSAGFSFIALGLFVMVSFLDAFLQSTISFLKPEVITALLIFSFPIAGGLFLLYKKKIGIILSLIFSAAIMFKVQANSFFFNFDFGPSFGFGIASNGDILFPIGFYLFPNIFIMTDYNYQTEWMVSVNLVPLALIGFLVAFWKFTKD